MVTTSSVKAKLWSRPNAQGLHPVMIKITVDGKHTYKATGIAVPVKFWDDDNEQVRATHPLAEGYNKSILGKKKAFIDEIGNLAIRGKSIGAKALKAKLSGGNVNNVFTFVNGYLAELSASCRAETLDVYRAKLKILEKFNGSTSLCFEQVDHEYLKLFSQHLQQEQDVATPKGVKKVLYKSGYIKNMWSVFSGWFSLAVTRNIADQNPFLQFPLPTSEVKEKDYLTQAEVDALEAWADALAPTRINARIKNVAYWFLFGCYTGLRVSDWYRFDFKKQVVDNEIRLRAKKNGGNISLPMVEDIRRIVNKVRFAPLPPATRDINYQLKRLVRKHDLDKHLSSHCARKTFAVTRCASLGINLKQCAQYMGITVAICEQNYYRITEETAHKMAIEKWERKAG